MSSYSSLQVSCAEDGATPVSWGCPAVPLGSRKPGAARPTSTFLGRTGASILAHGSYDNGRIRFTLGVVHSRTKVCSGCCVQQDQVHSWVLYIVGLGFALGVVCSRIRFTLGVAHSLGSYNL